MLAIQLDDRGVLLERWQALMLHRLGPVQEIRNMRLSSQK